MPRARNSTGTANGEDLRQLSSTYPELALDLVVRDNLVSLIRDRFTSERKVIVVRGAAGSGKTTLLAQFVASYPSRCISYFIGRDIWTSSAQTFLFDLSNQILALLGKRSVAETIVYTQLKQIFSNALVNLYYIARTSDQPFFIVVDSLDHVKRSKIEDNITDLIPTDLRGNVYLLLSSATPLNTQLPGVAYVEQDLPPFSLAETSQFLTEVGFDQRQVRLVQDTSRGFPAYVYEVRRQVRAGGRVDELVQSLPPLVSDLFRREWARVGLTQELRDAMAALAFAPEPLSLEEWEAVTGASHGSAQDWLQSLSFIREDKTRGVVDFHSGPFVQFASEELADLQAAAELRLTAHYERQAGTARSATLLPALLQRTRDFSRLKSLLTNDYLLRSLELTKDLSLVHRDLALAGQAAFATDDLPALLGRVTSASLVKACFERPMALRSEVAALGALGRFDEALEFARQALLPQDQLELISVVAEEMQEAGVNLPDEIIDSIDSLSDQVPTGIPPDDAARIAARVFPIRPDSALRLIERCIGGGGTRPLDRALAILSLRSSSKDAPAALEKLQSSIQDQSLRDLVRAHAGSEFSASDAVARASAITGVSSRLFLLRNWCNTHRNEPDAHIVISQAFDWILEASDYTPPLRLLRQVTEPLEWLAMKSLRSH